MTKPRAKAQTVRLEIPATPDTEPPLTAAERAAEYSKETSGLDEDDAQELFAGLDELRATQGVLFQVHRTEPVDRAGYCREYPANIFSLERVTKDYGPGVYRVKVKANARYIPGGGTFKIAEGVPVEERVDAAPSSVQDMLAVLKADKDKRMDTAREWAVILAPLLVPVVSNLFGGNRGQVSELIQGLAALKELQPPPPAAPDMMTQLDTLSAALGKLKELRGDEAPSTGSTWVDVARDAITSLSEAARPMLQGLAMRSGAIRVLPPAAPVRVLPQPAPHPQPAAAPPAPVAAAPAADSTTEVQPVGLMALVPWLRQIAADMAYQASRDKDPELYAAVVTDNLPQGANARELLAFIERADWWEMLQQVQPAVVSFPGWFEKFRAAVIDELRAIADEQPAPPQPAAAPAANE